MKKRIYGPRVIYDSQDTADDREGVAEAEEGGKGGGQKRKKGHLGGTKERAVQGGEVMHKKVLGVIVR